LIDDRPNPFKVGASLQNEGTEESS
jgi:hypothetical protein